MLAVTDRQAQKLSFTSTVASSSQDAELGARAPAR